MGNLVFKLRSTSSIIREMHLKLLPIEKTFLADACDELSFRFTFPPNRRIALNFACVELLMELLKRFENDEIVIKTTLRAIRALVVYGEAAELVLEVGGRDVIDVAMNRYKDETNIRNDGKAIINILLTKASTAAIKDVARVGKAIQYTVPLSIAETMNVEVVGNKRKKAFIPTADDEDNDNVEDDQRTGIQRVTTSMKRFAHDLTVVEWGLEALLLLARKGVNPRCVVNTDGIECIVTAMTLHARNRRVQWRCLTAILDFAKDEYICSELGKRGTVACIIAAFTNFAATKDIRQQALWCMSALFTIDHCRQRLEEAGFLVILYKLVVIPIKSPGTVIDVVVPLNLKKAYSHDILYSAANPVKAAVAVKVDRKFGIVTNPAYGTVDDFFTVGEPGLFD